MKHKKIILSITAILVLISWNIDAKIKIVNPTGSNLVKDSVCPLKDGKNNLNPVPIVYLKPPEEKGVLFVELESGDTKFPSPKWTFKKGAELNGTLNVDIYKSKFKASHQSGAEISIRYVKEKGDPANIRWIQLIETTKPLNKATSPYIDPYPSDDPPGYELPFYYTQAEIPSYTNGTNGFGKYDLHFYDFSSRYHPPIDSASWKANLYIASWDEKTNTVTIHDGIQWGWYGACK